MSRSLRDELKPFYGGYLNGCSGATDPTELKKQGFRYNIDQSSKIPYTTGRG